MTVCPRSENPEDVHELRQALSEERQRNMRMAQELERLQSRVQEAERYRFLFEAMEEGFCIIQFIPGADDEQVLQIERCRLLFAEVSCHHEGWDESAARDLIERLGDAIAQRFAHRPLVDSPEHLGVKEYEGLHRAAELWEREVGFRHPLTNDAAA